MDTSKLLLEKNALSVADPEKPFWYTSGMLGPYFINAQYLAGGKDTSEEILKKMTKFSDADYIYPYLNNEILNLYFNDEEFKQVIDLLFSIIKEKTKPACTAKKIPGLPLNQKKSLKLIGMYPAMSMLSGSPTRVPAPWRLLAIAIPIRNGTGETSSCFDMAKAIGATMSTVATFSPKVEIIPEIRHTDSMAHPTFFDFETSISARYAGTLE